MSATAAKCYDAMLKLGAIEARGEFSGGNDEGHEKHTAAKRQESA